MSERSADRKRNQAWRGMSLASIVVLFSAKSAEIALGNRGLVD
ncbi:MAG: hypothetical protein ACIALR_17800 [Blastopirellula sp. JB062]